MTLTTQDYSVATSPGRVMALAPGRRIPGRHCTWCAHTPHAGPCPVITDKQPCPCARREATPPPPTPKPTPAKSIAKLREVPPARPLTPDEKDLTMRPLQRYDVADLADMLGVAA